MHRCVPHSPTLQSEGKANHLALLYLLARSYTDGRTMRIKGLQPVAVVDFNVVAVAAAPGVDTVGNGHCAGCSRQDLGSVGCGDVGTVVVFDFPGKGILPISKGRGDGEGSDSDTHSGGD